MRPGYPMGPGPVIRPSMQMGPGPEMCPSAQMGAKQDMCAGPAMHPAAPMGECMDQYPVAMAYVPWQRWQQVYPVEQAFCRGTIFPDLDKPFVMGRCR